MKKLISSLLFLILTSPFCFCLSDFHFSLSPRFSFTNGKLSEILCDYDGSVVSLLDWEQKPLFDIGLEANFSIKNIIISTAFDYSVPFVISYMYDSDFENGERYSFTVHPLIKSINYNFEATLAYAIKTPMKITVLPELHIQYMFSDFNADKGTGTRNGRDIRVNGIDYYRHSFFLFTGLSVNAEITSKLFIKTSFYTAPWNFQYAFDYHHGQNYPYPFSSYEIQDGFFSKYKLSFSAEIKLDDTFSLELFTNFIFGYPDRGPWITDYRRDELIRTNQPTEATIHSTKIGASLKFSF